MTKKAESQDLKALIKENKERVKRISEIALESIGDREFVEGEITINAFGKEEKMIFKTGELEKLKRIVGMYIDNELTVSVEMMWAGSGSIRYGFRLELEK